MDQDDRANSTGRQHAPGALRQRSHDYFGFVNPPVVHASTVLFPDAATMAVAAQKYTYGTRGTPTTDALAAAIDELEGSAGTIIVPSASRRSRFRCWVSCPAGDHVLIVDSVYHPTRNFADTMLRRWASRSNITTRASAPESRR